MHPLPLRVVEPAERLELAVGRVVGGVAHRPLLSEAVAELPPQMLLLVSHHLDLLDDKLRQVHHLPPQFAVHRTALPRLRLGRGLDRLQDVLELLPHLHVALGALPGLLLQQPLHRHDPLQLRQLRLGDPLPHDAQPALHARLELLLQGHGPVLDGAQLEDGGPRNGVELLQLRVPLLHFRLGGLAQLPQLRLHLPAQPPDVLAHLGHPDLRLLPQLLCRALRARLPLFEDPVRRLAGLQAAVHYAELVLHLLR
mmetsp:Transcript_38046/g.97243  ORF Transcript_38046/g.97243 Transcript_38046/m.97243 type:complete len:254 (-) Transcript_38046:100-861(-)